MAEKCPVCNYEIKGSGVEVRTNEGKTMKVCSPQCAEKAKTNPRQFAKSK